MSEESVLLVMDNGVRQAHITDDDDDFVDPPRRCEVISHQETPRIDEGPSGLQHFLNEEQYHGIQGSAVEKLQPLVDRKWKGKVNLTEEVVFPSSLKPPSFDLGIGYTQPDDLQSAEIQKQEDAVISDVITASQNIDEEGSPTTEPASELPIKWASRPARTLRSPFVVGEGKVSRHDGNVIVFENYKDHVEEADKSVFLGWFQRGYKPKNRKKFNEHDDQIKPAFSIDLYPVGHNTWFHQLIDAETSLSGSVLAGIEPYVKLLPALTKALGISKKDPDYNESKCKQMKVTIDSTLPQQTNGHDYGVFVILYALYILRDGRCAIPH
ncbi:Hypothetical predicted protein [Olea europaea subsp. europaea]|uniref:Ubiquitin-like protease family profile domain-containing protein n=1 Tax=Olea europaea subsp. europaea TaxID=158383 RepID=A0A8S0PE92_OLEEU|nr:Hypothetical predicted protein [Olea europaea subsp. europaea]